MNESNPPMSNGEDSQTESAHARLADIWMANKIELKPIEELIPYARNPRTHSEDQVAQLAGSIKAFGFTNPVLIDGKGGIVAGHGRVMAARRLGLAHVTCHMHPARQSALPLMAAELCKFRNVRFVPFSEVATQSHYLSNLRTDSIKAFLPRVYVERSEI
ncbi:MAG: hypothetical protein QOJ15_8126 [Bradyrhizobium sp.]|nr:hypothetical protein [Bradyrhizobium sp.]